MRSPQKLITQMDIQYDTTLSMLTFTRYLNTVECFQQNGFFVLMLEDFEQ